MSLLGSSPRKSDSARPRSDRAASGIALRGVRRQFGQTHALDGVDLEIAAGEFVALVGPSGCGKSTLLRTIAGVEEIDAGQVIIGGEDATDLPASARNLAMVFQGYALYSHLTVFRNLALPLEVRKFDRDTVEARVTQAADLLDIAYLLNRRPGLLSGGQQQRVALARALMRDAPLYLLDEPLSSLDAPQRRVLRIEIARMHRMLGATFIYATHDQAEAMTMADRIAVMRDGRIEQVATPAQLFDAPASAFVADFIDTSSTGLAATMDRARRNRAASERLQ